MSSRHTSSSNSPKDHDGSAGHALSLVDESSLDSDKKRSSRACDQCRKTKSKCKRNPNPQRPCVSCESTGNECTFLGPSFKRGPPKGYIHALELRLRQVESVFGAILSSQDLKAQELIADLQRDDQARDIISRVEHGPFGPSGRSDEHASSQEAFMAAITQPFESRTRTDGRSNRESRLTRENVSVTGKHELQSPTLQWQDALIASLERTAPRDEPTPDSQQTPYDVEGENPTAIGKLAVDEHNQLRFHGESSGMPLLSRSSERIDERSAGGLWRFPMSLLARAQSHCAEEIEESLSEKFPPVDEQDSLVDLYFTYVHPILPVVHKAAFLEAYKERHSDGPELKGTRTKKLSNLLLLSMFAIASRYNEAEASISDSGEDGASEADLSGSQYYMAAHESLDSVFRISSISTVQAMVILSYRQFGMGALEQGWIYCGFAIRMAQSLGLHRAADEWGRFGIDMFSPIEKEERKLVWWSCAIVEKYISCSLGRPVSICERNFDTELPDDKHGATFAEEEEEMWAPHRLHGSVIDSPQKAHTISCLRAAAALSVIVGLIVDDIYSLRPESWQKQLIKFNDLEMRLDRWYNDLPLHLQFDVTQASKAATPHILTLHFQYWSAVILLHRKFIPERQYGKRSSTGVNRISLRSFDLCQTAATNISALAAYFKESYSLLTSCAFAPSYLLTAGIVHIATLALKPNAEEARSGLQEIMATLEGMETVWPSALRNRQLLNGAKVKFDEKFSSSPQRGSEHSKRGYRDAFGQDVDDTQETTSRSKRREEAHDPSDAGTHWVAYMLGLNIPGVAPIPIVQGTGPNTFNPTEDMIATQSSTQTGESNTTSQGTSVLDGATQQQSSSTFGGAATPLGQISRGGNMQTPFLWDPDLSYYPFDAYDFQSFTNSQF